MAKNYSTLKSILIADDDVDDQLIMKEIIDQYVPPVSIQSVYNGKDLMEHLCTESAPDLLLMDLNMPFKGGLECLKEMRRMKQLYSLPVVVLSTSRSKLDADQCFTGGAQLFFTKPWDIQTYKVLIHSILEIDWKSFKKPTSMEQFRQISEKGDPFFAYN
jgi:CheY-like chemotaxis protein